MDFIILLDRDSLAVCFGLTMIDIPRDAFEVTIKPCIVGKSHQSIVFYTAPSVIVAFFAFGGVVRAISLVTIFYDDCTFFDK